MVLEFLSNQARASKLPQAWFDRGFKHHGIGMQNAQSARVK